MMFQPTDDDRKWWILWSMGLISGLILLDETILGTALPSISKDLGLTETTSHWVINAYLLVFSCLVAAGGKTSSLIGPRKAITIAGSIFILGSALGAVAQSGDVLITARMLQGLGGALLFPIPITAVSNAFSDEERGKAIGFLASTATLFLAAGPLLGGAISSYVSWRLIFVLNIPVVLIAMIAANMLFPKQAAKPKEKRSGFDFTGLALLAASMGALTFSLMEGSRLGWYSPLVLGLLTGSAAGFVAFFVFERGKSAPLLHVELLRNPTLTAATFNSLCGQFSKMTTAIFIALYLQQGQGYTPLMAGLIVFIAFVPAPIAAPLAGKIADKFGSRPPALAGLCIAAISTLGIAASVQANTLYLLLPLLLIWGFSLPFCFIPSLRVVMGSVAEKHRGEISGLNTTVRQTGATLSLAIGSAVLAASNDYALVFAANGLLLLTGLLVSYFFLREQNSKEKKPLRA
jgi:EmrB/QacA subfamily drug resistance transporter